MGEVRSLGGVPPGGAVILTQRGGVSEVETISKAQTEGQGLRGAAGKSHSKSSGYRMIQGQARGYGPLTLIYCHCPYWAIIFKVAL